MFIRLGGGWDECVLVLMRDRLCRTFGCTYLDVGGWEDWFSEGVVPGI